jgi:hypothetical protein
MTLLYCKDNEAETGLAYGSLDPPIQTINMGKYGKTIELILHP